MMPNHSFVSRSSPSPSAFSKEPRRSVSRADTESSLRRGSDIRCRGCSETPAEIGEDLSTVAVAFTCSRCLMREVDARPTCRRCLGEHWGAECEYTAAEAKVVHAIRSQAKL